MAVATLAVWLVSLHGDPATARTIAFTTIVLIQTVAIQIIRARYRIGIFSNRYLIAAVAGSIGLQLMVVYVPMLQPIFHTVPLGLVAPVGGLIGYTRRHPGFYSVARRGGREQCADSPGFAPA